MKTIDNWIFETKHKNLHAKKVAQRYYKKYKGYKQVVVKNKKGLKTLKWVKDETS